MKQDNFKDEMNFINAPQFPGQQLGNATIEQIRGVIKRQKRLKGFSHIASVGVSEINLDLSGTARILLGVALFKVYNVGDPQSCFEYVNSLQFTVNNEIVIDQLNPNFLSSFFNTNEYYYIPRPLSGTDQLTIKFQNNGAQAETVQIVIYYI